MKTFKIAIAILFTTTVFASCETTDIMPANVVKSNYNNNTELNEAKMKDDVLEKKQNANDFHPTVPITTTSEITPIAKIEKEPEY